MKRTSKRAPGRSRGGYRATGELRSLGTSLPSLAAARDHPDSPPLARAKSQWLVGDWNALCELDADTIASHPERDRLALLVACAHQQLADHELAREYTRRAIGWGCDPKLVARLLISGVHNTLGRVAALKADDGSLHSHFTQALAVTGDTESGLATPTRAVRELADLGLLPQAAGLLLKQVAAIRKEPQRPLANHTRFQSLADDLERLQRQLAQVVRSGPSGSNDKKAPAADERSGAGDNGWLAAAQAQWRQGDWKSLASKEEALHDVPLFRDFAALYTDIFSRPAYSADDHIQYHFVLLKIHELGFRENFNLLDISSGRGHLISHINKLYPNAKVTSSDIKRFHQEKVSAFIKCDLSQEDDRNVLRASGSFDIVTCTDVLEHLEKHFITDVLELIADLAPHAILAIANHSDIWNGQQLHLIQEGNAYWESLIKQYFEVIFKQNTYDDTLMLYVLNRK